MTTTAATLEAVAKAARFTSTDAIRMHLRRTIERINQQGDRIIRAMESDNSIDDYTQIVQAINDTVGEALTVAAQLDVLASIARTVDEAKEHQS